MTHQEIHEATLALGDSNRDPVMARLVRQGTPPNPTGAQPDLFRALIQAVASQQLSTKAAAAIVGRFEGLFETGRPDPLGVLRLSVDAMRAAGFSMPKVRTLQAMAQAIFDGDLDLDHAQTLPDEEFIDEMTRVRGIGRWTAEMLLIFDLGRPDVFSVGDLGLRTAVSRLYHVDRDERRAISGIADSWKPHRSAACHYLWASLGNPPMKYGQP